ncbi:MAG: radical SAM protein [Chloroflexota bacterium]
MSFTRPEIIRPPSEHRSYFLPVTGGCSNNTCTFCNFYGAKLALREIEEVKEEIDALALYAEEGICRPNIPPIVYYIAQQWDGKRVFLQDGDALVYPLPRLKAALKYLNERFPTLERIGAYATPQDIQRRTPGELKELRELKLSLLYMGIESGDDEILKRVGKGATHRQIVDAARKAKAAGTTLSATVILGLGGVEASQRHALATARILTETDPDYVGALTLTLVPGTPLYRDWQQGHFLPVSPFDSIQELKLITENVTFSDCFFSSMHASNYLSIRGRLPREKDRIIRELEGVLAARNPYSLRPEYLRGL